MRCFGGCHSYSSAGDEFGGCCGGSRGGVIIQMTLYLDPWLVPILTPATRLRLRWFPSY